MDGNRGGHYLGYITLVGSDFMKPSEFKSGMAVRSNFPPYVSGILLRKLIFYRYINNRGYIKYRMYCVVKTTTGRMSYVGLNDLRKY